MKTNNSGQGASLRTGITPDLAWIKKYDEIIKNNNKTNNKIMKYAALFLAATVVSYFLNIIVMIVLAVITALLVFLLCRRGRITKAKRIFFYKEGLLIPSIIVNTNPLTILACANLSTDEDIPDRFACYTLEVENLPGTEGRLYERVPCSGMFEFKRGSYNEQFQPHPLCWATADRDMIRADLYALDQSMIGEVDEWALLESVAKQAVEKKTVALEHNHIMVVDDNFIPVREKGFLDDLYEPCPNETVHRQYRKEYPQIPYITDEIPSAGFYNKIIDLALKYQVYEYISSRGEDGDFTYVDAAGYYTYFVDWKLFADSLMRIGVSLSAGEIPLIIFAGKRVLTTKGFWEKHKFKPWSQIRITTKLDSDNEVQTLINGKRKVSFKCKFDFYKDKGRFSEKEQKLVRKLEQINLQNFLLELRTLEAR